MRVKAGLCAAILLIVSASALVGCGGGSGAAAPPWEDGAYTGVSGEDDKGAYGEVRVTVEDGAIVSCEFVTWQKDGSVKGEDYGKVNGEISNQEFYDKAQLAVEAMSLYADKLVETQSLEQVDAISGATNSHGQFLEAVIDALEDAKSK
jgi:major membrane immunogen (membrane-anchored lipoprotein)